MTEAELRKTVEMCWRVACDAKLAGFTQRRDFTTEFQMPKEPWQE